jgi:hypothetical protein
MDRAFLRSGSRQEGRSGVSGGGQDTTRGEHGHRACLGRYGWARGFTRRAALLRQAALDVVSPC